MARLRYNGLSATLGADLTNSGTTITFTAALTSAAGAVPTVTGTDYIPLTLLTSAGAVSEIVYLTAYTAGATTGTIARGKEGTTGVTHASGDVAVNSGTVLDFTSTSFTGCRLRRTAAFSVGSGVAYSASPIPWDTEDYDTSGFHDPAVNPTRVTIPAGLAGYYSVAAGVGYSVDNTGRAFARLEKNGVAVPGGCAEMPGGTGVFPAFSVATTLSLADGDYLEFVPRVGATVARDVDLSLTAMTLTKLG